jgi:hypothetical protein
MKQKIKIGYDEYNLINYIAARNYKKLYYTLFFLINEEKVLFMPMKYFQFLNEFEMIRNSGRKDQLLDLNFESITESFVSHLEYNPHFCFNSYYDILHYFKSLNSVYYDMKKNKNKITAKI